jgi:hemoglobin
MTRQIKDIEDIKYLVDKFYGKVREDELLKDIFNDVIKDRWPEHLNKMYRFWETVLLGNHTYQGSPFAPHAKLPVERQHFNRWLKLFYETLDELFIGEVADEAKWRGERMAEMFQMKINYYKDNPSTQIL